jgi:glycosyltransferase involved in cell wall biosynthesis
VFLLRGRSEHSEPPPSVLCAAEDDAGGSTLDCDSAAQANASAIDLCELERSPASKLRVLLVSSWRPRRCGVAEYTGLLADAMQRTGHADVRVLVLRGTNDSTDYVRLDERVVGAVERDDPAAYRAAAATLRALSLDAVLVQHEFGLLGGAGGDFLSILLAQVRVPVYFTIHTPKPADRYPFRGALLAKYAAMAQRVFTMTDAGCEELHAEHGVPLSKCVAMPHGAPDFAEARASSRARSCAALGVDPARSPLIASFGLLTAHKGFEYVVRALPELRRIAPGVLYVVAGGDHDEHQVPYGSTLRALAAEMGVADSVFFIPRFLSVEEIGHLLRCASVFATPYLDLRQMSSGALSMALRMGVPTLTTPFPFAKSLLVEGRDGFFVEPASSSSVVAAMQRFLGRSCEIRVRLRRESSCRGDALVWPRVADRMLCELRRGVRATTRHPLPLPPPLLLSSASYFAALQSPRTLATVNVRDGRLELFTGAHGGAGQLEFLAPPRVVELSLRCRSESVNVQLADIARDRSTVIDVLPRPQTGFFAANVLRLRCGDHEVGGASLRFFAEARHGADVTVTMEAVVSLAASVATERAVKGMELRTRSVHLSSLFGTRFRRLRAPFANGTVSVANTSPSEPLSWQAQASADNTMLAPERVCLETHGASLASSMRQCIGFLERGTLRSVRAESTPNGWHELQAAYAIGEALSNAASSHLAAVSKVSTLLSARAPLVRQFDPANSIRSFLCAWSSSYRWSYSRASRAESPVS